MNRFFLLVCQYFSKVLRQRQTLLFFYWNYYVCIESYEKHLHGFCLLVLGCSIFHYFLPYLVSRMRHRLYRYHQCTWIESCDCYCINITFDYAQMVLISRYYMHLWLYTTFTMSLKQTECSSNKYLFWKCFNISVLMCSMEESY